MRVILQSVKLISVAPLAAGDRSSTLAPLGHQNPQALKSLIKSYNLQAAAGYASVSLHLCAFSTVLRVWQIQVSLFGTLWDVFPNSLNSRLIESVGADTDSQLYFKNNNKQKCMSTLLLVGKPPLPA